ncbi:MAG: zinc metalloprotease HtpX, partial [Candidatus Limnocylindrales bacterium]
MSAARTETFYSQITHNRRESVLLVVIITAILAALGLSIGYGLSGSLTVGVVAMAGAIVLAGLLSSASYFNGDSLVLAASQAREVNDTNAPQLLNVVRELSLAAGVPPPRVYIINDSAPNA